MTQKGGNTMSVARGYLRLAKRYEIRMKYIHKYMVKNRNFHITQLREAIGCVERLLDISYEELENWSNSIQALYETDEFDNIFERVELIFFKMFVNCRYDQTLKEITVAEEAKRRMKNVLNKLEVLNCF